MIIGKKKEKFIDTVLSYNKKLQDENLKLLQQYSEALDSKIELYEELNGYLGFVNAVESIIDKSTFKALYDEYILPYKPK